MRLGVRAANGDAMQVSRILSTAALMGGMMYMSRSYLNSMGRSDQEDYMKRRMEMSEFLQGALSQIGAASLFGYIYQITTGTMDGNTSVMTPPLHLCLVQVSKVVLTCLVLLERANLPNHNYEAF